MPYTQLLVCALPRDPDNFANLTLRQRNPATAMGAPGTLCELEESLGKSAWKVQEHDIFKLLGGVPKAPAQQLDQLEPELGSLVDQWYEISSLDD